MQILKDECSFTESNESPISQFSSNDNLDDNNTSIFASNSVISTIPSIISTSPIPIYSTPGFNGNLNLRIPANNYNHSHGHHGQSTHQLSTPVPINPFTINNNINTNNYNITSRSTNSSDMIVNTTFNNINNNSVISTICEGHNYMNNNNNNNNNNNDFSGFNKVNFDFNGQYLNSGINKAMIDTTNSNIGTGLNGINRYNMVDNINISDGMNYNINAGNSNHNQHVHQPTQIHNFSYNRYHSGDSIDKNIADLQSVTSEISDTSIACFTITAGRGLINESNNNIIINGGEKNIDASKIINGTNDINTDNNNNNNNNNGIVSGSGSSLYVDNSEINKINQSSSKKKYKCNYCIKSFVRKCNLEMHIRVHTNEKPFICNICNKGFKQQHSLKEHKRLHTGEKPYKCNFNNCNKSFTVKYNLKVHKRVHTGERPYCCNICFKRFTQKGSLNTHLKTQHNNKILYT